MSPYGHIIDLDELVLKCRDEKAREYIRESVACYKAGAYRSAIVAAWIAVVFDILSKLSELELTGDRNAKLKLENFEQIVSGGVNKLKEALDFERGILQIAASEFELLTPNELQDLIRLQEDRNRCAHPSLQALGTVYQPTAELARCHIRNAVEILLAREPVQGKAAFDRICAEVKSEYFPTKVEEAVEHFKRGPLARARENLVRDLLLGFTRAFLNDKAIAGNERHRLGVAVGAIIELYKEYAEKILRNELPKISASVNDEMFKYIIRLIYHCPLIWDTIGDSAKEKTKRYLQSVKLPDINLYTIIFFALSIPELEEIACNRAIDLPYARLSDLLNNTKILPKFISIVSKLISKAKEVNSYRDAEKYYEMVILPLGPIINSEHIGDILDAVSGNAQAYYAGRIPDILVQFFDNTITHREKDSQFWKDFKVKINELFDPNLLKNYSTLFQKLQASGIIQTEETSHEQSPVGI